MKSTDIKIAIILILNAALSIILLTCCDKNNSSRMLWSVYTYDQDNVEVTFDPSRRPQIEIVASAEGGQCQIACPNFKHVSFREKDICTKVHADMDCQFLAKITGQGIISVNLDKIENQNSQATAYFIIDGDHDGLVGTTVVKVTRKV